METIIRPAAAEDRDALAVIKTGYVQNMFRGVVPQQELRQVDPKAYEGMIAGAIEAPGRQVLVMEQQGHLIAYMIFGADPEEAGYGMVFDTAFALGCDQQSRNQLMASVLAQLREAGMEQVHFWLLRENFYVRYQLESFGFREENLLRTVEIGNRQAQLVRYLYADKK